MKFKVNDTVILIEDKEYNNGDKILAGTKGKVISIYPLSTSYLVKFPNTKIAHRLIESSLN